MECGGRAKFSGGAQGGEGRRNWGMNRRGKKKRHRLKVGHEGGEKGTSYGGT